MQSLPSSHEYPTRDGDFISQNTRVLETDENLYSGISGIKRKATNKGTDFQERFQGRQSLMNKEGHIGVVRNTNQPIVKKIGKIELSQNLLKESQK